MKIVYIITRLDEFGGAQIHIRDLALYARNQGHEVVVLSGMPGKVSELLAHEAIPYYAVAPLQRAIHPLRDIRAVFGIARHLKAIDPDIVSCHSAKARIVGGLAARLCGLRQVIATSHGWSFTEGIPPRRAAFYRLVEKMAAALFFSQVITVCEYDRQLALKNGIAPADKVTTVHNGMPWIEAPSRVAGDHDGAVRLVMVARFAPQKDHETLLRALAGLTDLDWRLDLIGNGDDMSVREIAAAHNLEERVYFRGERPDVPDWLMFCDIFCLITNYEGFPRSILEAMRAARPVVATDVAGVGEAVVDGETGRLVPRGDVAALQSVLRELIADKACQARFGALGRRRYEENFTLAHMADKSFGVYTQLTGK